jgi:hypothetical protein
MVCTIFADVRNASSIEVSAAMASWAIVNVSQIPSRLDADKYVSLESFSKIRVVNIAMEAPRTAPAATIIEDRRVAAKTPVGQ